MEDHLAQTFITHILHRASAHTKVRHLVIRQLLKHHAGLHCPMSPKPTAFHWLWQNQYLLGHKA